MEWGRGEERRGVEWGRGEERRGIPTQSQLHTSTYASRQRTQAKRHVQYSALHFTTLPVLADQVGGEGSTTDFDSVDVMSNQIGQAAMHTCSS